MAAKRKGLGRGLDALLGTNANSPADAIAAVTSPEEGRDGKLSQLPVEFIQRGKYQPRRDMNQQALQELAESIKNQGVMQPIVVRPIAADRYEIIAGERRWRATQLAGLDTIPCVIREVTDEAAIAMALIENIQREDLNPIEEAIALKRLQDEFGLTHQEVAEAVGKSRTTITNLLRLISLTEDVKTLLEHGDLEMGHARALLTLEDGEQSDIARQVVAKGLSVRQTEALVRKIQQGLPKIEVEKADADVSKLEESLSEKIGVPVSISYNNKGKGKLVLNYSSLDELDGILVHLGYNP
ncbi:MAG: ParB/RepB/Spo0J family partition protein [Gammaproteobacteria bacterium]|uniref:ParB/RepB/Spo0J family partition protein n=1 Tax=Pseudomaricurvus alcaniphilus TaxID=1166482 RepID=UPI00140B517A|nr:ParB/RepB/Spo0J family partition protein [Pseudomaricurvus alcaniphilus]MBR9909948.1 ParB/RepB/Spo0J family partition protein [Gammaproteobacteria bacterium]NHN38834.1 ParB/RepB/Spo0J family partition protein [Pseudomaricurvus alcaniphilus]